MLPVSTDILTSIRGDWLAISAESVEHSSHSEQTWSQYWSALVTFCKWLHSLTRQDRPASAFLANGCKHCKSCKIAFLSDRRTFRYLSITLNDFLISKCTVFFVSSSRTAKARFVPLPISMSLLCNQLSPMSQSMVWSSAPSFSLTTSALRNILRHVRMTSVTLWYRICTKGSSFWNSFMNGVKVVAIVQCMCSTFGCNPKKASVSC